MASKSGQPAPRTKPLKRPQQARARFTVQAIFDAYVRIWQRDGWDKVTTRAVALETGVAIGTLYDYFPSKEALHSGYVRHCIERLIQRVDDKVVAAQGLNWQQRLRQLIRILSGNESDGQSWFHPDMLQLEPLIADQKHQRRAYEELLACWQRVFDSCTDLPRQPAPATVEAMHLAVWGGRRYAMLVNLDAENMDRWAQQAELMCLSLLNTSN